MKTEFTSSPLIITDTEGIIIYKNEAAHSVCAAPLCGDNIFDHIPALRDACRRARAAGHGSFMLRPPESPYGEILVDLTKEPEDGVLRLYLSGRTAPVKISYEDVAREFSLSASGLDPVRRVTALYDMLSSSDTVFFRGRDMEPRRLTDVLSAFFDSALPRMRQIGRSLILRLDSTVDENVMIECDVYAFCLLTSALAAAAGYASKDAVTVTVHHTGSESTVTVSANIRAGIVITDTASFGPHAPDVIYAETLARASGYSLFMNVKNDDGDAELVFTLRIRAGSLYSDWIKTGTDTFFIACCAEEAAKIIED